MVYINVHTLVYALAFILLIGFIPCCFLSSAFSVAFYCSIFGLGERLDNLWKQWQCATFLSRRRTTAKLEELACMSRTLL